MTAQILRLRRRHHWICVLFHYKIYRQATLPLLYNNSIKIETQKLPTYSRQGAQSMKHLTLFPLAFFMLFIAGNLSFAAESSQSPPAQSPAAEQEKKNPDLEKQKQKLEEDAQELAQNFRDIFQDLTGISKSILLPFIDKVSQWIKNNYAELSQQSREKLKKSMKELRKRMNNLENKSREETKELFQDFQDLLDSLRNKEKEQREAPPELVPA